MPTTSRGLRYPSSTDDVRPYEDIQFLATDVNTALGSLAAPPVAVLRQTVAQALANNTFVTLTFTTEDIDSHNGHSTSSNTSRYTAQVAGTYELSGGIGYDSNSTGIRYGKWLKNGTEIAGSGSSMLPLTSSQPILVARTVLVALSVGDYVEMQTLQTSGGSLNTYVGASYAQSTMNVRWVSE